MYSAMDMFKIPEKLKNRVKELEGLRFIPVECIMPMKAMEGQLGKDEVYRSLPEKIEGGQKKIGDEFAGWDSYLWLEKTVTLPEHRDGCEVYGMFDFGKCNGGHTFGFESLLYVNGEPYQGVDTNHKDVNFEKLAGQTVTLTFMMWTGLEEGHKRTVYHRFQQADIGYMHTETDKLYYLGRAIVKTCDMLDEHAPERHDLLYICNHAIDMLDYDPECFYETVPAALEWLECELKAIKKTSDITVNMIGHTHIDVAWLWRLKHTREKAIRSFSTVLKLMDEDDSYIFLQTQPQLYQYIKSDCPELYEKIKKRVAEGRWEADGGMWLEADCNLTSGESLTRQFLYGIRFLQQEFGRTCEYLWLPDVFGYSWALPQILKGVNINTFMTTKIGWNEYNNMPHDLFKWRGIDGSEVMTYFITTAQESGPIEVCRSTYNGNITPRAAIGSWKKFRDKNLSRETLVCYGHGDGGGGVSRDMLKMRWAMEQIPGLPNVPTCRANEFFRRMHDNIEQTDKYVPVWDGELYLEYHRGTYTSQAYNKKTNRKLEFALAENEWLSERALQAGGKYDQATLLKSWQTVLRNQFHDIIPGSSIEEVYQDCHKEYDATIADLKKVETEALRTFVSAEKDSWTLWHFGSFARTDDVFIEESREGSFVDAEGKTLTAQKVEGGWLVNVTMAPLSFTTIRFVEKKNEVSSPFTVDMDKRTLATPIYQIAWNENGELTSVYDLENKREVVAKDGCANQLRVYEDKPVKYDNWNLDISYQFKYDMAKLEKAELVECGALRAVIRFTYSYRHSKLVQDMTVYADNRRIDFKTQVDWNEKHRVMKAAFPVTIRSTRATYDIQYGHAERPTHYNTSWDYARFEVVGQKWADLSEEGYGVSILNDCKYGYSVKDNLMQITLLRCGTFPDHHADEGHHEFTYALLPHVGTVAAGDTIEEAVKLNLPIHVAEGKTAEFCAFRCNSRSVAVDAIKKAEDGNELILRIHECRGSSAEVELSSDFNIKAWTPCNLLEEVNGERHEEKTIKTSLHPFEIKTFRIEL